MTECTPLTNEQIGWFQNKRSLFIKVISATYLEEHFADPWVFSSRPQQQKQGDGVRQSSPFLRRILRRFSFVRSILTFQANRQTSIQSNYDTMKSYPKTKGNDLGRLFTDRACSLQCVTRQHFPGKPSLDMDLVTLFPAFGFCVHFVCFQIMIEGLFLHLVTSLQPVGSTLERTANLQRLAVETDC